MPISVWLRRVAAKSTKKLDVMSRSHCWHCI